MNYFEKIGAHHVDCDGDDGGDVSDSGNVEDSHGLPCCGFLVSLQVFANSIFLYFSAITFWIHGHPPHIKNEPICECFTEYLTTR